MTKQLAFVPEERMLDAPDLPTDRPPTRAEVWSYVQHYYHDTKSHEQQVRHARELFAGNYVWWTNQYGWRKHPDWDGVEPVIPQACPKGPITPDNRKVVWTLLDEVKRRRYRK